MLHEDKELCFRVRLPHMPLEKWLCFSGGPYVFCPMMQLFCLPLETCHLTTPKAASLKLLFQRYINIWGRRELIPNIT